MSSNYSSEFKQDAVKLAVESDQSVAKTARDLGVDKKGDRFILQFFVDAPARAIQSVCKVVSQPHRQKTPHR